MWRDGGFTSNSAGIFQVGKALPHDRSDVALDRSRNCSFSIPLDDARPERAIDAVVPIRCDAAGNSAHDSFGQGDVIGIAPHEPHMAAVGSNLQNVPRQKRSFARCACRPMQDGTTGEMAAASYQSRIVCKAMGVAGPENNVAVCPHGPFPIGVVKEDWDPSECLAPRHHRAMVVGMRYGDRLYAAKSPQRGDRRFVRKRQTIPKNVSFARLHQQGPLTNRKMRFHAKAQEIGLKLFSYDVVCPAEVIQVSPLLPRWAYILPFIEADRT